MSNETTKYKKKQAQATLTCMGRLVTDSHPNILRGEQRVALLQRGWIVGGAILLIQVCE